MKPYECNFYLYSIIKNNFKNNSNLQKINNYLKKGYIIESILDYNLIDNHYSKNDLLKILESKNYLKYTTVNYFDKNTFNLYKKNLFISYYDLLKFVDLGNFTIVLKPKLYDTEDYIFNCFKGGEVSFYCSSKAYLTKNILDNFGIEIGENIDISNKKDFLKILFLKDYFDGKKYFLNKKNIKIKLYKNNFSIDGIFLYSYKLQITDIKKNITIKNLIEKYRYGKKINDLEDFIKIKEIFGINKNDKIPLNNYLKKINDYLVFEICSDAYGECYNYFYNIKNEKKFYTEESFNFNSETTDLIIGKIVGRLKNKVELQIIKNNKFYFNPKKDMYINKNISQYFK